MTNLELSAGNQDEVRGDLDGVDSGGHQYDGIGVIMEDGEYSVSNASEGGEAPRGLSAKQKAAQEERATLGRNETRAIFCLRVVFLLALVLIGSSCAVSVYFIVLNTQQAELVKQFGFYADQVIERFHGQLERKLDASDTLSTGMTSYALASGSKFPFVTVPDFVFKGANARIAGDTVMTFYMPYITEDLKAPWEAYAVANFGHDFAAYTTEVAQTKVQDQLFGLTTPEIDGLALEYIQWVASNGTDLSDFDPTKIWYSGQDDVEDAPPYFPLWHITPHIPDTLLNLDVGRYDFLKGAIDTSVNSGEVVFGILADLTANNDGDNNDAAVFDLILQSGQYRHSKQRYEGDPMSAMIYPVFDGFNPDRKAVGALFTAIYWRFMMNGILPESINGVVCVLENSFGQMRTYEIRGPEAFYLGEGDFHDSSYDDMERSIDLVNYLKESAGPESRSYTSAEVNGQFLNYTLRVYPTSEFEEIFINGEALTNSLGVAIIFAAAISLFLVYDCCVQRRQRIVLERAVRATAVVSSLYPANIREQIINDQGNDPTKSPKRGHAFLRSEVKESGLSATPLATKYPNCTVYFADLAGFTKWSSTRQPEQVFQLLESLFKEFDAVAVKRGVFKVETIGDCYMAVTGLPHAQPDHAVIMAKFAHDCMLKLDQIVERLAPALGEGTEELALRTGMHSGEVTAGVLRGEKGRFQLFGDTVNTASRMESTGTPRRIQVSQSTADALIMEGKESWLVPRREKVFAKGKGEMQTYFLELKEKSEKPPSSVRSSERTHETGSDGIGNL